MEWEFDWPFIFFWWSLAAFVLLILVGIALLVAMGIGAAVSKDSGKAAGGMPGWFLKALKLTSAVFLCSLAGLFWDDGGGGQSDVDGFVLEKETEVDGIRLPAGTEITLEAQEGGKRDLSGYFTAALPQPADWNGIAADRLEHNVSGAFSSPEKIHVAIVPSENTVEIEGWRCAGERTEWEYDVVRGRRPERPADYRFVSCNLDSEAGIAVPQLHRELQLYFEQVERVGNKDGGWLGDVAYGGWLSSGTVWFDRDKNILAADFSLGNKVVPYCDIYDNAAELYWRKDEADIVRVKSIMHLPEQCWDKKVVRVEGMTESAKEMAENSH